MQTYRPTIRYKPPREALGEFLANLQLPNSDWNTMFNDEQKEYWYKKADAVIEYMRRNKFK